MRRFRVWEGPFFLKVGGEDGPFNDRFEWLEYLK